jgi:hypothetical protein
VSSQRTLVAGVAARARARTLGVCALVLAAVAAGCGDDARGVKRQESTAWPAKRAVQHVKGADLDALEEHAYWMRRFDAATVPLAKALTKVDRELYRRSKDKALRAMASARARIVRAASKVSDPKLRAPLEAIGRVQGRTLRATRRLIAAIDRGGPDAIRAAQARLRAATSARRSAATRIVDVLDQDYGLDRSKMKAYAGTAADAPRD